MSIINKLSQYGEHHLNVMLIGSHGIGKTTVVRAVAEQLGMVFQYYSSSTLDPFAELIGIPVPDTKTKTIDFYRPEALEKAEFIFFDELNRAHPRVLNTVLEIIQFKSINGVPLPNLKMVWAAINPPGGDYQVEELDPALQDRFHCYMKMQARVDLNYMKERMDPEIARCLKEWWDDDLNDEQKGIITPRRIEYMGKMLTKGLGYKDSIPQGRSHNFPLPNLDKRLRILREGEDNDFILNKENILKNRDDIVERLKTDKKLGIKVNQIMEKFSMPELFECRAILEEISQELVNKVLTDKWKYRKSDLRNLFTKNSIDIDTCPKISKACEWSK